METVKQHFEEEAREFDEVILRLIPYYPQMVAALVAAIPFEPGTPIQVIDLGCGTGTVAQAIQQAFPQAQITCLDIASNMIEMAKTKIPEARFQVGDFCTYTFDAAYDLVVSSLALHHLVSDAEKITFYQQIAAALKPGGAFLNADVVLASSERTQAVYIEQWKAFMRQSVSEQQINQIWLAKYAVEDHPARLMDQLAWLARIGLQEVDVIWKYYNFAVYGGRKADGT